MLALLNRFPQLVGELEQGKSIRIDFAESYHITAILTPIGERIKCQLRKFGNQDIQQDYELDKEQVIGELRRFLIEVMQLAVDNGYVTLEDKERFIAPAFPEKVKSAIVA